MIRSFFLLLSAVFALSAMSTNLANATPPAVGETATDFALKTLDDRPVHLKSLFEKGPVVLVFLRGWPGYQCPLCTAQVGELIKVAKELGTRKAQVVLVYPGPAENLKAHAAEFSRGKSLPDNIHLVVDPDYAFTKQYDLRWDAPRETAYPSTFVIETGGKIVFAKISRKHGGRAKASEIFEALGK